MKNIIKKIKKYLPKFLIVFIYFSYEKFHKFQSIKKIKKEGVDINLNKKINNYNKKRVLVYHKNGLSFGGTEKFLQIIAKYLPKDKFEIFFMASWDDKDKTRKSYLENEGIKLINFKYSFVENKFPYFIHEQKPDTFSVIRDHNIDIILSGGAGYSEYPLNLIKNIPIILIGVFGYAVIQKNIKLQVYISKEVGDMVKKITYGKTCLLPILSEDPKDKYIDSGSTLRNILVIPNDYTVFGRIGRDDNGIFDSIGIEAFKKLLLDFNDVAYLIMSPPPALRDMVAKENIKNVYFLESSSSEHDIWSFHNAIDVLAHFRKDGESQGLNIVESMLCAKPIITHKSRIWNAHLEYLDESFCRIANIDDVEAYYNFMKEMVLLKKDGKLEEMGLKARKKAESIFLIKNRLPEIINWFENI